MRRRPWVVVGGLALVGVALLGANVSGAVPLPFGPMGDRKPATRDNAFGTMGHAFTTPPFYLTVQVENTSPVPVTVLGVRPIGETVPGSVEILGSRTFDESDPSQKDAEGMSTVVLGTALEAGPGWSDPDPVTGVTVEPGQTPQQQGRSFLVRITPDPERATAVLRFEVDYAVGPLRFVTTAWGALGTTIVFCGPEHPDADHGCVPD